jgi:hypothetical protein
MQVGAGSLPPRSICLAQGRHRIDARVGQTHSSARARAVDEFAPILKQTLPQSFMRQCHGSIRQIKRLLFAAFPPAGGVLPAGLSTARDVAVDGAVLQPCNSINPAQTGTPAQSGQDKGKIE